MSYCHQSLDCTLRTLQTIVFDRSAENREGATALRGVLRLLSKNVDFALLWLNGEIPLDFPNTGTLWYFQITNKPRSIHSHLWFIILTPISGNFTMNCFWLRKLRVTYRDPFYQTPYLALFKMLNRSAGCVVWSVELVKTGP